MAIVEYKAVDVLTAARRRVAQVFDAFPHVTVSVSSGKDSTVLFHLTMAEAARRRRKVEVFFLDQEAEYDSSITRIAEMMTHPLSIPRWYQVPLLMTNATSHRSYFLHAWEEGVEWMRPKHPIAIHHIDGDYPKRFYGFFEWHERQHDTPTALLVGLRSKESLTRFRAVTRNPGYRGIPWSTKTGCSHVFRFYPIYDWTFGDVWKFIADEGVPYNRVYDWMFSKHGVNMATMRVSNLIHEKSFRALADLQEFEPDTYDRLVRRLGGVHCAALYCADEFVYAADRLPATWKTWREYRDYLLATTPIDKAEKFRKRFRSQRSDETTCRQQVKQLLLNDWENNVPVRKGMSEQVRKTWWDRL
jgi:predicted phosphoadenosine phosphosulfate sulfurtransferase